MKETQNIEDDAEYKSRNKIDDAENHLRHLLKMGYNPQGRLIQDFAKKHYLEFLLRDIVKNQQALL